MIPGLGVTEMILIFAVLLLLFGAKRLPELAGGMGKGIRDFKRALNGMDDDSVQAQAAPQVQARTQQPSLESPAAPAQATQASAPAAESPRPQP